MDSDTMALIAALGGVVFVLLLIGFVLFAVDIIANWKIFEKAGIPGWAAIIPIYNIYCFFKLAWSRKFFWINMLLYVLVSVVSVIQKINNDESLTWALLMIVLSIIYGIIQLVLKYKLAKSFGQGVPFFIGLVFIEFVFKLVLAFGRDEYVGNQITGMPPRISTQYGYQNAAYQNQGYQNQGYHNQNFQNNGTQYNGYQNGEAQNYAGQYNGAVNNNAYNNVNSNANTDNFDFAANNFQQPTPNNMNNSNNISNVNNTNNSNNMSNLNNINNVNDSNDVNGDGGNNSN